jgi:hypothetical protein
MKLRIEATQRGGSTARTENIHLCFQPVYLTNPHIYFLQLFWSALLAKEPGCMGCVLKWSGNPQNCSISYCTSGKRKMYSTVMRPAHILSS